MYGLLQFTLFYCLFSCNQLYHQTNDKNELATLHACFQGPVILPGNLSHTRKSETVDGLSLFGGGKIRIDFSTNGVFQTQHEQALIYTAAEDDLLCWRVLYSFDGVIQSISQQSS